MTLPQLQISYLAAKLWNIAEGEIRVYKVSFKYSAPTSALEAERNFSIELQNDIHNDRLFIRFYEDNVFIGYNSRLDMYSNETMNLLSRIERIIRENASGISVSFMMPNGGMSEDNYVEVDKNFALIDMLDYGRTRFPGDFDAESSNSYRIEPRKYGMVIGNYNKKNNTNEEEKEENHYGNGYPSPSSEPTFPEPQAEPSPIPEPSPTPKVESNPLTRTFPQTYTSHTELEEPEVLLDASYPSYDSAPSGNIGQMIFQGFKLGRKRISVSAQKANDDLTFAKPEDPITLQLKEAFRKLDVEKVMKVGLPYKVQLAIARTMENFSKALSSNDNVQKLKVTDRVKVSLKGEDFEITPFFNNDQQYVPDDAEATWNWTVKPLKMGTKTLIIIISTTLKHFDLGLVERDFPIYTETIEVKVNAPYLVREGIKTYWQWFIGLLLGTGVLWKVIDYLVKK